MGISNKRELQQIASNHLSIFEFKGFMKLWKSYTKEPFPFLVKDTTLPLHDLLLKLRMNLL